MQYGYTDTVSTNWLSQNGGGNKLAHATASQLLIWETVVGERDAAFNKVSTGGCAAVIDQISADHPLRDEIMNYYNSVASNVQSYSKLPSFSPAAPARRRMLSKEMSCVPVEMW